MLRVAAWTGLVAAIILIGLPSLFEPFGRDQGIHAYIAFALDHGHLPYRDVYNVKAPLTTGIHWLSQALFGHGMAPIRLMDLVLAGVTAAVLVGVGARLNGNARAGFAAALCFLVLYFSHGFWARAQTDGWMAMTVAFAVAAAFKAQAPAPAQAQAPTQARDRRAWIWAAASGVLAAAAILFKVTGVVFVVVPLAVFLRAPDAWRHAAAFAGGLAGALGGAAIAMFAWGLWGPFWDIQASLTGYVALRSSLETYTVQPLMDLFDLAPLVGLAACAGLVVAVTRPGRGGVLLLWLVAAFLSGALQGKGFRYHFVPMILPLALLAGAALSAMTAWLFVRRAGAALTAGVLLAVLVSDVPRHWRRAWPVITGARDQTAWWGVHFATPDYHLADHLALAEALERQTSARDRIVLWGYDPGVLYLARRLSATRFIFTLPLAAHGAPERFRATFLRQMRREPPDVLIVQHGDALPHVMGHDADSAATLQAWKALRDWHARTYRFKTSSGRFDLWYIKEEDPSQPPASRSR